jgi:hypothetical protein
MEVRKGASGKEKRKKQREEFSGKFDAKTYFRELALLELVCFTEPRWCGWECWWSMSAAAVIVLAAPDEGIAAMLCGLDIGL